ncbi:MAG: alanine racemase [Acidimicrobiales bacterium]
MGESVDAVVAPRRAASRPVWAEIDLAAVRHNARLLRQVASPAALCAVVKADGYGHGAVAVGRAALEGGATWLAVATVEEGVALREAGIDAAVLVLSEPSPEAMGQAAAGRLIPTVYSLTGVEAAEQAAAAAGRTLAVHVKVDTGMHRVGADPSALARTIAAVVMAPHLECGALWTHLAVADGTNEEDREFTVGQLRLFSELRRLVADLGVEIPLVHVANSAATICFPESHLDMVRCGIALFGVLPCPALEAAFVDACARAGASVERTGTRYADLRPALSLRAEVSHVRRLEAGERPSYGRLRALSVPSVVATVPVGYADGIPRRYFSEGGTVLIGGHRRPLAGAVTMDQIMVDCGADAEVSAGDEVVLIGRQGDERLTAWDWAEVLGTISYEVLCGIGPRIPRIVADGGREEIAR